MSYTEKGIESLEVAKLCYEKKYYNSCVNRYYYSFYQELMHKLSKRQITINEEHLSGGSHEKAFNQFISEVFRPINRPNPRKVTDLRTKYGDFKNIRALADYKPELLSKDKVDEAIKLYEELKVQINII